VIVVDTSALVAIVLQEAKAAACIKVLETETEALISAGTLAEALIVSIRRRVADEMASLLEGLSIEIVTVTPAMARRVAQAYERWGRGMHPAGLNFGDCFAYALAKERSCPLLFIGNDFSKTDVKKVL
jgi:ribonuclease VapC